MLNSILSAVILLHLILHSNSFSASPISLQFLHYLPSHRLSISRLVGSSECYRDIMAFFLVYLQLNSSWTHILCWFFRFAFSLGRNHFGISFLVGGVWMGKGTRRKEQKAWKLADWDSRFIRPDFYGCVGLYALRFVRVGRGYMKSLCLNWLFLLCVVSLNLIILTLRLG